MYVLSYRWWDSWREYSEKHSSTQEFQQYVDKVRESIASHVNMSDDLKKHLLEI